MLPRFHQLAEMADIQDIGASIGKADLEPLGFPYGEKTRCPLSVE